MVKYLLLATAPALLKAQEETCMAKFANDDVDNDECGFRNVYRLKNWIELINCPDGEESGELCRERTGAPWRNPKWQEKSFTYQQQINFVLRNYGCNCFLDSKMLPHPNQDDKTVRVPGVSGHPVDALDQACQVLAKRSSCLLIDNQGIPTLEGQKCDYRLWYSTFFNPESGQYECGTENNPGYDNMNKNEERYNTNQCRKTLCEMDREFAMVVAPMLKDPFKFYEKNSGKFNIAGTNKCVIVDRENKQDQCCGWDFERNPFSSVDQRCCDGEIFKADSMEAEFQCVDDNEVM